MRHNCVLHVIKKEKIDEPKQVVVQEKEEYEKIEGDQYCDACLKKVPNVPEKCLQCGCHACSKRDGDPERTVSCDQCYCWYHFDCIGMKKIPDEEYWYCSECKNDAVVTNKPTAIKGKAANAKRTWGRGMACAAVEKYQILPSDHVGKIPGVKCGQVWEFRVHCAEAGVHRPIVAGIAGSGKKGAVSLVIAGGYDDDQDEGDWFLYCGSGGRDFQKNGKNLRNAPQSSDQKLEKSNLALALTCDAPINKNGAEAKDWRKSRPVRVVRSFKAKKHNAVIAPEKGYRYDGIYKLQKYYPEKGKSGFLVWKYLFKRDDDEAAPWTTEGKKRKLIHVDKEMISAIENDHVHTKRWKTFMQGSVDVLDAASKISKLFECPICMDIIKKPKSPSCGHSICTDCFEEMKKQKMVACPICRQEYNEVNDNKEFCRVLQLIDPNLLITQE